MKTTLKIGVVGVILALTSSTALQAQEEKIETNRGDNKKKHN